MHMLGWGGANCSKFMFLPLFMDDIDIKALRVLIKEFFVIGFGRESLLLFDGSCVGLGFIFILWSDQVLRLKELDCQLQFLQTLGLLKLLLLRLGNDLVLLFQLPSHVFDESLHLL